jgi:hypothetical protein
MVEKIGATIRAVPATTDKESLKEKEVVAGGLS